MLTVDQNSSAYLPSSLLSKRIGEYNKNMTDLLPFLRDYCSCTEIVTEDTFHNSFKQMCQAKEPTIVAVRSSGSKNASDVKSEVMRGLCDSDAGYFPLEVNDLIQLSVSRHTEMGKKIQALLDDGSNVWAEPKIVIEILKKVIYSGNSFQDRERFLLIGFPDQIEQAQAFEENCCNITAIVYATDGAQPTVEIKGDDLSLKCLDSIFAKQFRLRSMSAWDVNTFEDALGKKVQWGIVYGRPHSGAKECAETLKGIVRGKIISMKQISDDVRKSMATEDGEYEGDIPIESIEDGILSLVSSDRFNNEKYCYLFAEWEHKTVTDFMNKIGGEFGLPSFCIHCVADKKTIEDRYKKANEADDIGEDAQAELAEQATKDSADQAEFE